MGGDREGTTVKEMTAREILDAIRSGLEETSRRFARGPFAKGQLEQARPPRAEHEDDERSDTRREKAKL
jgi:hypothetical protein